MPEIDSIAATKQLITTELTPREIFKHQAESREIINNLTRKKPPKSKLKFVDFNGFNLFCEVSEENKAKPFIPKSLTASVFQACHDLDHCGQAESKRRIRSAYYWPSLGRDTSKYVRSCHPCQSIKPKKKYCPKPKTFKVPDKRFQEVHIDVVGPLPESEGMRYILTLLDRKSRWLESVALPEASSLACCNGFIRGWLARYGACQSLICDNGNTFTAKLWTDLQRVLGIQVTYVPRYHQSTNEAIERQHRTLKESIKASLVQMGDDHGSQWMTQLPFTLLGRRVALQPDLGASPAQYLYGTEPILPGVILQNEQGKENDHQLLKNIQVNSNRPAVPTSRHCATPPTYMPPETKNPKYVYVEVDNPTGLQRKFSGPYPVMGHPSNTTITILVGYTAQGIPKEETHHWSRIRVADMRPKTELGNRPRPGRQPRDEQQQNNRLWRQNFTQPDNNIITQPRSPPSAAEFKRPAVPAELGRPTPNILDSPYRPQNQNNNNEFSPEPRSLPEPGLEPGGEPLPPEVNGRLAPPVTKGAPTTTGRLPNRVTFVTMTTSGDQLLRWTMTTSNSRHRQSGHRQDSPFHLNTKVKIGQGEIPSYQTDFKNLI